MDLVQGEALERDAPDNCIDEFHVSIRLVVLGCVPGIFDQFQTILVRHCCGHSEEDSAKARIERILAVRDPSGVNRIVKEHDLPVIAYLTKGHTLSTFHLVRGPVCAGFIEGIVIRSPGTRVPGFTGNICYRQFSWHALHQFAYEEGSRKHMDV